MPVIGYAILIFYISSLEITIQRAPFAYYDKVFHLAEYGVFVWLWHRALRVSWTIPPSGWIWIVALVIAVAFAALDEIYQSKTPTRMSDPYDFMADAIGAFSVLLFLILKERR